VRIKDTQLAACSSCGAPIRWIRTEDGFRAPVNIDRKAIYTDTGTVDAGDFGATPIGQLVTGYESHFATCPNADQHRKKQPAKRTRR